MEWSDAQDMHLKHLLHPLQFRHLSHLGSAYRVASTRGKFVVFQASVKAAFGEDVDELTFNECLAKILDGWPFLLVAHNDKPQGMSSAVRSEFVECDVGCCSRLGCSGRLWEVAGIDCICVTLSAGLQRGRVLFKRCSDLACASVHGGCWRWDDVAAGAFKGNEKRQSFPGGFWHPICAIGSVDSWTPKYFFAEHGFAVEVSLLRMLLGFMSRGGMSLSAFFEVYQTSSVAAFGSSGAYQGESGRLHFTSKMLLTLMAWGSVRLLRKSLPKVLDEFHWHLRPHHEANYFCAIVAQVHCCVHGMQLPP